MIILEKEISNETYDFIQIVISQLLPYQKYLHTQIKPNTIYTHPEENYGLEDDIHITTLYGIVDEKALPKTKNILKKYKPFSITIKEISKFYPEDKEYEVIKYDIESPVLHQIHQDLKNNIKNEWEWKIYSPHITIGYVLPNTNNNIIGKHKLYNKEIMISEIIFTTKQKENITISL